MIPRGISKSNGILLSYTFPIGTTKSANNKAQCVRVRIAPTIRVQSFIGMENGTPIQVGIEPSTFVINYELDEKFARDKLMFRL